MSRNELIHAEAQPYRAAPHKRPEHEKRGSGARGEESRRKREWPENQRGADRASEEERKTAAQRGPCDETGSEGNAGGHEVRNVVLVAPDRVGPQMAGPGIRYAELARILSRIHDVTLAAHAGSSGLPGFPPLRLYDPAHPASLQQLLSDAEVVVGPPLAPA